MDNLIMAYIQGKKCSCTLYIVTNCNIIVFKILYTYIYKWHSFVLQGKK